MAEQDAVLNIRVVLALSDEQYQINLVLPAGTTARQAVLMAEQEGLDIKSVADSTRIPIGVFGEQVDDNYVLVDEDRVELYRPLLQSQMELRRRRAAAQEKP